MDPLTNKEEEICRLVMQRMIRRRRNRARSAAIGHGVLVLGAAASAVPAFRYAASAAQSSGFSDYVSLIASDWSHLTGSWGSLAMSIVESAPLMAGIAIFGILLVIVYAARGVAIDMAHLKAYPSY